MALGCDSPTLPASRNRLYWTRIPPWASRVLGYSPFQPSTHYTPKWNEQVKIGPKIFVMVRSLGCDFWKQKIPNFHPCFGWMPIHKPPDLSRWIKLTDRNDCATSPCQSCKWSRRPQVFYQIYTTTVTMSWGEVGRILIVWFPVPSFCFISMFVCRAMILMAKILDLQDMNYMNSCKSLGRFNALPINVRRHNCLTQLDTVQHKSAGWPPGWLGEKGDEDCCLLHQDVFVQDVLHIITMWKRSLGIPFYLQP